MTGSEPGCDVSWCNVSGWHSRRHYRTLGTWFGQTVGDDPSTGMTVQLVLHGSREDDARPVLVLVNPDLEPRTAELSWTDMVELVGQVADYAGRFR